MLERKTSDGDSAALARKAILVSAILAGTGSGLGCIALRYGQLSGFESVLVLSSCLFSLAITVILLAFPQVPLQTIATAATVCYTLYLLGCVVVTVPLAPASQNLFVYLLWFFPLLVFNKLVNSPDTGRLLAKIILVAPLGLLICIAPQLVATLGVETRFFLLAYCLSYLCFGIMLNAVTRYREAFVLERERAESLRIESEVLESISDCFISLNSAFLLDYLNDAACAELAVDRKQALHASLGEACPGFFSPSVLAQLRLAATQSGVTMLEAQNQNQDMWYEMRCFPRLDGMAVYFRNTTEAVLSRHRLERANAILREQSELLDKAQDAIFVQDIEGCFHYWNRGAERLFGWTAQQVLGRSGDDIFPQNREQIKVAFYEVMEHGEWTGEFIKRHKDGHRLVVESRCTLLRRDDDGLPQAILAINTDITAKKAAQAKIQRLAFYDTLTGLPNRILFRELLDKALATARRQSETGTVLYIDLDDFKTLNETSGHQTGDLLLQQAARRLRSAVRKTDIVARIGGDEFVVMLEGLGSDPANATALVQRIGDKILRSLHKPYRLKNYDYQGSTSIGITLFQGQSDTVDSLFRRIDLAMYRAKAQGRNTICFFAPAMEASAAERAELQSELRRALKAGEFELHYQPQVDAQGRPVGAEALLRWPHPRRGMIPPDRFIPLAEESGLILELGSWVLSTGCAQLAAWARHPETRDLCLALNVSTRQLLDPHFVRRVKEILRSSGADPRKLKLEITESAAVIKVNDTIASMVALKALGVGFSMDDFGTGFSSLSQLKQLPLDQLKIDRCFVRDVVTGTMDASIVRTIIALGKSMNLLVIAEGVETAEQLAFLESEGCTVFQGFLFSPALPAASFESFLAAAIHRSLA